MQINPFQIFFLVLSTLLNFSQSKISILGPKQVLYRFNTFLEDDYSLGDYSISNFGYVPYGQPFQAPIRLAYPFNACTQLESVDNSLGNLNNGFILLVQKTNQCSFVQQVKNAQRIGAKMVIIGNDSVDKHSKLVVPSDVDGSGQNLHIPSVLINERTSTILKSAIEYVEGQKQNQIEENIKNNNTDQIINKMDYEVVLKVEFTVTKTEKVDFKLFVDIENKNELAFIHNFSLKYAFLSHSINFRPIYHLMQCKQCKNHNFQEKADHCLGGGRYCHPDPDGNGLATGRDLLYENIRQLCIYKNFGALTWFDYMDKFFSECAENENFGPEKYYECSHQVVKEVFYEHLKDKLYVKFVECETSSFEIGITDDPLVQKNTLLEENAEYLRQHGYINMWPGMTINGSPYRGSIYTQNVMEAICASLEKSLSICDEYNHDYLDLNQEVGMKEKEDRFDQQNKQHKGKNNISTFIVVMETLVITSIFFLIIFIIYKIYQKKYGSEIDSNALVNERVTQYIQFYEAKQSQQKNESSNKNNLNRQLTTTDDMKKNLEESISQQSKVNEKL